MCSALLARLRACLPCFGEPTSSQTEALLPIQKGLEPDEAKRRTPRDRPAEPAAAGAHAHGDGVAAARPMPPAAAPEGAVIPTSTPRAAGKPPIPSHKPAPKSPVVPQPCEVQPPLSSVPAPRSVAPAAAGALARLPSPGSLFSPNGSSGHFMTPLSTPLNSPTVTPDMNTPGAGTPGVRSQRDSLAAPFADAVDAPQSRAEPQTPHTPEQTWATPRAN
ncbi:hypothetical protein KFE25_005513 [Diacronema lutheri]|uniref:Uncharacterized protein n=1 Tax=Diacronema lutheri TaxID=2081491 RepID=A0A8J5XJP6_DIALT|nr:hypothetical protein KFE25_005513 [Diacronema lutheri]